MVEPELSDAEKQVGAVEMRLERQGSSKTDNRFLLLALFLTHQSQVEFGFGKSRIQLQAGCKSRCRLFEVPLSHGLCRLIEGCSSAGTLCAREKHTRLEKGRPGGCAGRIPQKGRFQSNATQRF